MTFVKLPAGYARFEAVMTFVELPAGYARFEAVMTFMELPAGYARFEAVMTFVELPAGYARFEAVMTFMESLIGTHFIRYVGTNMQHIIKETIYLAGTSADWQGVQLPETVYEGAQQMLLTLSNIHTLNNIENFANTQGDEVTGDVGDFLAGVLVVTFH